MMLKCCLMVAVVASQIEKLKQRVWCDDGNS